MRRLKDRQLKAYGCFYFCFCFCIATLASKHGSTLQRYASFVTIWGKGNQQSSLAEAFLNMKKGLPSKVIYTDFWDSPNGWNMCIILKEI